MSVFQKIIDKFNSYKMTQIETPSTWQGNVPELNAHDLTYDMAVAQFPKLFPSKFNSDPLSVIRGSRESNSELDDPSILGCFLFNSPHLLPSAITRLLFGFGKTNCSITDSVDISDNNIKTSDKLHNTENFVYPRSILFHYYSSMNMELMSINDAAYYLLPRIAFPKEFEQISAIFEMFGSAYSEKNQYQKLSADDAAQIGAAVCMLSMFCNTNCPDDISFENFSTLLSNIDLPNAWKQSIYNKIKHKPIPIFLEAVNMMEKPNYRKSGVLKKPSGLKVKRFFSISIKINFSNSRKKNDSFYSLKYYKDDSLSQFRGIFDLSKSVATFIQASNKRDQDKLIIRKIDGGPIFYKVGKDHQPKWSNKTQISLYENERNSLHSWASNINYISFLSQLDSFISQKKKNCC